MEKKIFFVLLHGLLFCNIALLAQNWTIGGNNLPAAGGQIGSNNNRAIIFKTNNIERGRITPADNGVLVLLYQRPTCIFSEAAQEQ